MNPNISVTQPADSPPHQANGLLSDFTTDRRVLLLCAQRVEDADTMTVVDAGTADPVTVFPDATLDEAMSKMLQHNIGRLPVVARDDSRKIVGYLGRAEILAARMRGHEEERHREKGPLFSRPVPKPGKEKLPAGSSTHSL